MEFRALRTRFSDRSSRPAKLSRHHSHARRGRCHGTPPFSETRLWICRGRCRASRERTGSTAYAASARGGRTAVAVERGCPSRCHQRRRGGASEARRGAGARRGAWAGRTSGLGAGATSGLGTPPLGLAETSLGLAPSPSLGLAPPSLGLAPSSLAPPLLAPPLLLIR